MNDTDRLNRLEEYLRRPRIVSLLLRGQQHGAKVLAALEEDPESETLFEGPDLRTLLDRLLSHRRK